MIEMEKGICRAKMLTFLVMIIIITAYVVNAQLTSTVKIESVGEISTTKVWARSGSAEDIQAAVDAVAEAGGGIVYIPAGDFTFNASRTVDPWKGRPCGVVIPAGVSVFGAGKDVTNLTSIWYAGQNSAMFFCDGSNCQPIRISGITFKGYVYGDTDGEPYNYVGIGVRMYNCKNFRVDHCRFIDFPDAGVACNVYTHASKWENGEYQYWWNWGVVDHCDFDQSYKLRSGTWRWGYGVGANGAGRTTNGWLYDISDILGRWDIESNPIRCALYDDSGNLIDPYGGKYFRWLVYVEDCTFKRCRHAITSSGCVWYVARHNRFEIRGSGGMAYVDVHGRGFPSGRGAEVYDNIFEDNAHGIWFRGGGGVVFNNTFNGLYLGIWINNDYWNSSEPEYLEYVHDLWIWNNTFNNVQIPFDNYQNQATPSEDYFTDIPGYETDPLPPKPGYTPYFYPHPLTLE
jgi:hypothetical protein